MPKIAIDSGLRSASCSGGILHGHIACDSLNRIAKIVEAANNRHFGYSATGNMWVTTTSTAWAPTSFTPRSAEWIDAIANGRYVSARGVVARVRYVRTIAPATTIAIENANVCGSVHATP